MPYLYPMVFVMMSSQQALSVKERCSDSIGNGTIVGINETGSVPCQIGVDSVLQPSVGNAKITQASTIVRLCSFVDAFLLTYLHQILTDTISHSSS